MAQLTTSISFIFSGSNRHLLSQLFDDRNRPFYKLCERITLDRISESAYEQHIQRVAKEKWQKLLPESALASIFSCTERHPYYMNLLCSRLFGNTLPTAENVYHIWQQYVLEERSSVAAELELLTPKQRKLITVLARTGGTPAPLGKEFIHAANMSKATLDQAFTFLEKRDYVMRDAAGIFKVLDPLIKFALAGN